MLCFSSCYLLINWLIFSCFYCLFISSFQNVCIYLFIDFCACLFMYSTLHFSCTMVVWARRTPHPSYLSGGVFWDTDCVSCKQILAASKCHSRSKIIRDPVGITTVWKDVKWFVIRPEWVWVFVVVVVDFHIHCHYHYHKHHHYHYIINIVVVLLSITSAPSSSSSSSSSLLSSSSSSSLLLLHYFCCYPYCYHHYFFSFCWNLIRVNCDSHISC